MSKSALEWPFPFEVKSLRGMPDNEILLCYEQARAGIGSADVQYRIAARIVIGESTNILHRRRLEAREKWIILPDGVDRLAQAIREKYSSDEIRKLVGILGAVDG